MEEQLNVTEMQNRLTKEAQSFTRPLAAKLTILEPFKEPIRELRRKQASFRAIAAILQNNGLNVSHDTVYRFCREILRERPSRASRPHQGSFPPAEVCTLSHLKITESPASLIQHRRDKLANNPVRPSPTPAQGAGPRIADSKNL
jgi:hypothetical protein